MSLSSGTRLGPYQILSLLGAGGMGEVYRAHDLQRHRDVAVKVLAHLSSHPDRLRRFEQEAQAAAALNHPNILAIHPMGTHDGSIDLQALVHAGVRVTLTTVFELINSCPPFINQRGRTCSLRAGARGRRSGGLRDRFPSGVSAEAQ